MKNIRDTFKEQPIVTAAIGIPILWLLFFCVPTIYVSSVHRIAFASGGLAFCGFISFTGAGIGLHDPYKGNKNIRKAVLIVLLCLCCLTVLGTLAIFLCTLRPSSFGSFGYLALRVVFGSIIATILGAAGFAAYGWVLWARLRDKQH